MLASQADAGPDRKSTGTISAIVASFDDSNACGADFGNANYSAQCISGDCECLQLVGSVSGNPIGRGQANILVTIDLGDGTDCCPFFADIGLSTNRDSETLAATGAICAPVSGSNEPVIGGFGITGSAAGVAGWGTASGSLNENTKVLKLTFSGVVVE